MSLQVNQFLQNLMLILIFGYSQFQLCMFYIRHYDDKAAEVGQGFWNCPCVPMRERQSSITIVQSKLSNTLWKFQSICITGLMRCNQRFIHFLDWIRMMGVCDMRNKDNWVLIIRQLLVAYGYVVDVNCKSIDPILSLVYMKGTFDFNRLVESCISLCIYLL